MNVLIENGLVSSRRIAERLSMRHGVVMTWVSLLRSRGISGVMVEEAPLSGRTAYMWPSTAAEAMMIARQARGPADVLWAPLTALIVECLEVSSPDIPSAARLLGSLAQSGSAEIALGC